MTALDRFEKAMNIARRYRGEVDGEIRSLPRHMKEIFPNYYDMTEEYLLADVMSRPRLTLREHSMIIITTLMLTHRTGLRGHMNWALNVGLSREEVSEIIMHSAHYGGWPAGEEIIQLINAAYPGFVENSKENPLKKVWTGSGLTPRERDMLTLAALVACRFGDRLRAHIAGALDNGISREEILEIIMQVTPFSGWPVGVEALRIASEVFKED
jgi:4-carboxymuconolactone decarboxylase